MNKADIILRSNAVYTALTDEPFAGGVALKSNKIIAVRAGDEIMDFAGKDTQVLEYGDNLIMPGLVDGHGHLWWGAVAESEHCIDITSSSSEEEAVAMIKEYAESHPDEVRIRGFGWFPANWNNAPLPTKKSLDEAVPDRPVYMNSADAHTYWVNSPALEESGYEVGMDLGAGSLGVDENGELNGLIYEPDAMKLAWRKFYEFSKEDTKKITGDFMACLAKQGVTCVSDMSADEYDDYYGERYDVFKEMAEAGEFKSRVHSYMQFMKMTDFAVTKKWQDKYNSDKFRIVGLKGFLDGVTSTYTGYLLEPYADRPDTCGEGVPLDTVESLNASVAAGNAWGLPVRIHCIADASVRMALDAFEYSLKVNGQHGMINAVEHIENIHPADIPRFKELGVIASPQPEHLPLENNEKLIRLGEERCRYEWPFRSMLDAGATMAFGTDFPVVYYNQFNGMYAALARKNYDGSPAGADNNEYITLPETLKSFTMGAAKVYGRDHELGSLEEGKLADVIVLDRNLFDCTHEEIRDAKVLLTVFDGKIVHKLA